MKKPKYFSPIMILAGFIITLIIGFQGFHFAKAKGFLMPGPISAMHPKNQPLNGYTSHADFANECQHCHAPIHCVTDTRCQDCHLEIARQRIEVTGLHGKLPGTNRCQNCHQEHLGSDVVISQFAYTGVDHFGLTGFSLDHHRVNYANEPMDCAGCHSKERFARDTLDCVTCHVQADHTYMAEHIELYGVECVSCHDGVDRTRDFDHNDYYVLEGQHVDAECSACHVEHVFAGTSQDCVSCHEDPQLHAGEFGLECQRCHTAFAWTPAQLTQHTFSIDHGDNPVENCHACHAAAMTSYDCLGCHDHTQEQIDDAHVNCNPDDYPSRSCAECHLTGESNEIVENVCAPDPFTAFQNGE